MSWHTVGDAVRAELDRVGAFVQQRDDAWAIPRETGEFLHTLVLAGAFRNALEVGTSYGYSGLWIGAALACGGGRLTTIENNPSKVDFARDVFRRAGLAEVITIAAGAAQAIIPQLAGAFDFVFLDPDKENLPLYFDLIWPKLAPRATIVTDNIISHADQVQAFVEHLRGHPELCSTLVPTGSGLELSVRTPASSIPRTAALC